MTEWKKAEDLVSWLEQYISPDARIETDVHLPVIGEERTRQCDVVVRIGIPPRDQFFIVEVQKRATKVDINDFGGWITKMNEVGAGGLICVSQQGFPSSVVQTVAAKYGPKVKLLTINPEGHPNFSWADLKVSPQLTYDNFVADIEFLGLPDFSDPASVPNEVDWDPNLPCISKNGSIEDAVPFNEFLNYAFWQTENLRDLPVEQCNRWMRLDFKIRQTIDNRLWLHSKSGAYSFVGWTIEMNLMKEHIVQDLPYTKWNYRQENNEGVAAWFATAKGEIAGKHVEMTTIWIPNEEGYLCGSVARIGPSEQL